MNIENGLKLWLEWSPGFFSVNANIVQGGLCYPQVCHPQITSSVETKHHSACEPNRSTAWKQEVTFFSFSFFVHLVPREGISRPQNAFYWHKASLPVSRGKHLFGPNSYSETLRGHRALKGPLVPNRAQLLGGLVLPWNHWFQYPQILHFTGVPATEFHW